MLYNTSNISKR